MSLSITQPLTMNTRMSKFPKDASINNKSALIFTEAIRVDGWNLVVVIPGRAYRIR